MTIEKCLQTFLKREPFKMQLLTGKGFENRGMAADIPKKYAFQDAIMARRRGMKIEEWLQAFLKTKPFRMHLSIWKRMKIKE